MADQKGNLSWNTVFGIEKFSESLKADLLHQLEKDLQHSFESAETEDFLQEITRVISHAVESNRLSDILYRVDISEPRAVECMNSPDPIRCLVVTILEREAQKVVFRHQYSNPARD